MNFATEEIKGKKVVERNGREVGRIDDVVIEPGAWKVDSFLVAVNDDVAKELDLRKKLFGKSHLRVGPEHVAGFGDYLTLDVNLEGIRERITPGPE